MALSSRFESDQWVWHLPESLKDSFLFKFKAISTGQLPVKLRRQTGNYHAELQGCQVDSETYTTVNQVAFASYKHHLGSTYILEVPMRMAWQHYGHLR